MLRKELSYYFSSPVAYIVVGLYWVTISLFLWFLPGEWNVIESGYADVSGLFMLSPWLLLLLCPALTMRLFAEERQSGMWEVLLTKPYPMWRIVLDKYLAAWLLTAVAIVPCVVHYFAVYAIAEPVGNVDGGQFAGSMVGLVCLSGVFTALGLMGSVWSKSQIASFISGVVLCFALYWLTLQDHFRSLSRGVIDVRDLLVFAAIILAALALALVVLRVLSRK